MNYILEVKQIVDYPRVRIHREMIQKLMATQELSARGSSFLYPFMILCSYANFRTSRRRIDGQRYIIYAGEWICSLNDLCKWFRLKRQYQAIEILDWLVDAGFIRYSYLPGKKMVQYHIKKWHQFNTVLEYECRCQKDIGFFFFPISFADKLIGQARCSELDIILDLWLNTIYMDDRVKGSNLGPVVYYRDTTGDPTTCYSKLAERWGISRATVGRVLGKMDQMGLLTCLTFTGSQGTVIYLDNYLSTMFSIADQPVDKIEVSFALKMKIKIPDSSAVTVKVEEPAVSKEISPVSKQIIEKLAEKAYQILSLHGFACCGCKKKNAKLYTLSDACGGFNLEITCGNQQIPERQKKYKFTVKILDSSG